jgi:hypothetical protein
MASTWTDLFRALGDAFSLLMTSEVEALRDDLAASRRKFVNALVLASFAVFVFFWGIGAATIAVFEGFSTVFPRWLAALFVLLLLLLIGAILWRVAMNRFRSIDSPLATAQRRLEDHLEWWQNDILAQDSQSTQSSDFPGGLESDQTTGRLDD